MKEDILWDYVFVGAGILGTISAKYLKERFPNKQILVIDKNSSTGQGNTVRSNAAYRNIFDTDLNVLLSTASINYYKHLESNKGVNLELQELGYLWLLTEEQYQEKYTKNIRINSDSGSYEQISLIQFLQKNTINFEFLSQQELGTVFPEVKTQFSDEEKSEYLGLNLELKEIQHGFLGRQCGVLNPDLVVKAYEKMFRELGGQFYFDIEVTRVLLKGQEEEFDPAFLPVVWKDLEVAGVEVMNRDGKRDFILTKNVILTTGAWINQLLSPLGINSSIRAKTRQLFTICNMSSFIRNSHFANQFNTIPFTILPIGGIFVKPVPNTDCVVVGCSDDIGREFLQESIAGDRTTNPKLENLIGEIDFYVRNILPVLHAYFPSIFTETSKVELPSAGNYAYSLDKFPVIQQDPQLRNFFFCSGASGSGIMKGDSIGRILSALICGDEEAKLYGGYKVNVADFSLHRRNLPKETLVL